MPEQVNREAEVRALYRVMPTESLVQLRQAFLLDAEDAQVHGDSSSVAFCVRRVELIEHELTSRGAVYG